MSTEETTGWFHDDVSDLPEYKQRARYRPMGVDNTGHLVDQAFRNGLPMQFNRELVKNAIEAHATIIQISPDWPSLHESGHRIYRYMIADNGDGMTGEEMVLFFNKLSSSGKLMDEHGNFGMGAKIALLPWNQAGLIVMSWRNGVGSMIKVVKDPFTKNYALEPWRVDEEDDRFIDYESAPDEYKPEWMGDHGTVIVCLGNKTTEDTYAGPVKLREGRMIDTAKAHRLALNDRFFVFPQGVDVRAWEFGSAPTRGQKPQGAFARVTGAKHYLDQAATVSGVTPVTGALVHWWVMPSAQRTGETGADDRRSRTGGYASVDHGFVGAMYDGEIYDLVKGSRDARHRHQQFGITSIEARKNIFLLVEPQANSFGHKAAPDTSRRTLLYPGGEVLPWGEWGEEFIRKMPEPILAEIRRHEPKSEANTEKMLEKLKELAPRMKFFALRPDASGTEPSAGEASGKTPKKRRRRLPRPPNPAPEPGGKGGTGGTGYTRQDPEGQRPATPILPRREPPKPVWEEAEGVDEEMQERAAEYVHSRNQIRINWRFQVFQEAFDYYRQMYAHVPNSEQRVKQVVQEVYGLELSSRVFHAMAFEGRAAWRDQFDFRQRNYGLISNEALTLAVLGIAPQQAAITTRLGGHFGGAPRSEAPDRGTE